MTDKMRPQGWQPRIFHRGDRVVMTKRAQRSFVGRPATGRVLSEPQMRSRIQVVLDGHKTPMMFYSGFFWKLTPKRVARLRQVAGQ
jgi:hypothetical protein